MSFLAILMASLIGSPHCAGMCGGFVAYYSGNNTNSGGFLEKAPHLFYSLGRLTTYLTLGAIVSFMGASLDLGLQSRGIQHAAAILIGSLMIIWGIKGLFEGASVGHSFFAALARPIGQLLKRIVSNSSLKIFPRSYLIGAISTLLPCGWLYLYLGTAAASGSVPVGILIMFTFWLGTLPIMLGLGALTGKLVGSYGRFIPRFTSFLLLLAGLFAVSGHLGFELPFISMHEHCDMQNM